MGLVEQWGVPLAVLGMLLATLFMAAVVKRHQVYRAQVRVRVQRLEHGIQVINNALDGLRPVPLSRELRVMLRGEILARLQLIARLYRRYPQVRERIVSAESALNAEGAPTGAGVGPIEDDKMFRRIVHAIDQVIDVLEHSATVQPLPRDVNQIFRRELGERRAEVNARFHLVQSMKLRRAGDMTRGRAHLTTLLHVLRKRGPSTDFVRELYAEAETALQSLTTASLAGAGEGKNAGVGSDAA